jgi:hypothetical protein
MSDLNSNYKYDWSKRISSAGPSEINIHEDGHSLQNMYETEADRTEMYEAERQHVITQQRMQDEIQAEWDNEIRFNESESRTEMCDSDPYDSDLPF